MLSDDQKRKIEALSTQEMAYEVDLGHKSRFQREKFAYLKTAYSNRVAKIPNPAPEPSTTKENEAHDWYKKPLGIIAISVISFVIGSMVIYLFRHELGIPL